MTQIKKGSNSPLLRRWPSFRFGDNLGCVLMDGPWCWGLKGNFGYHRSRGSWFVTQKDSEKYNWANTVIARA